MLLYIITNLSFLKKGVRDQVGQVCMLISEKIVT